MSDVIQAFLSSMKKSDRKRNLKIPKYERRTIFDLFNGNCAYCCTRLNYDISTSWAVIQLIPDEHGGPRDLKNHIPVCWMCHRNYVNADALDAMHDKSASLPAEHTQRIIDRRRVAFLDAVHHLTDVPSNGKPERVKRALEKRSEHERFKVYVQHNSLGVLVGMSRHCGSKRRLGEVKGLLRYVATGTEIQTSVPGLTVYQFASERLLEVVWAMIEENGLVVEVRNAHRLQEPPCADYTGDWRLTYTTITHNHNRLNKQREVEPVKKRELSTNPRTVQNRERYRQTGKRERLMRQLKVLERKVLQYGIDPAGVDALALRDKYHQTLIDICELNKAKGHP